MVTVALALSLAAFGLLSGLAWKIAPVQALDQRLLQRVNGARWPAWLDGLIQCAHPLGTKWWFVGGLVLLGLLVRPRAPWLAGAALAMALIERAIKAWVRRPRPFDGQTGVRVRQSFQPRDASFPSGDAARIWFLLSACATGLPGMPALCWALALAAGLVSVGRMRLGVHYFTDVWAGALLGIGFGALWAVV